MAALTASDGVQLRVEITGDGTATVVLVHGLAASIELGWRAPGVITRLVDSGARVVAYDARGHGRSEAPHDPARYGDARAAADLVEVVDTFANAGAVVAGYSMGSATILVALASGLRVRRAVLGATPSAVLAWTDDDAGRRDAAVDVLEGRVTPDAGMQWWVEFLDATGADKAALAALLRGHRPVIDRWERITTPVIAAAGVDDLGAAPLAALSGRLPDATTVELPGDHISAAASSEFVDAILHALAT